MKEVFFHAADILSYIFFVWCIILYYFSIRKCFLKGAKSKCKLFTLTLFTNPASLYIISLFGMMPVYYAIFPLFNIEYSSQLGIAINSSVSSIIYVALIFLTSDLTGKWLEAHNRQLVTFVSLMFGVILMLSMLISADSTIEKSGQLTDIIIYFAGELILFVASILLYVFDIKALAELTDKKRSLNKGLFTVLPAIFILLYNIFSLIIVPFVDITGKFLITLFTNIILFLFIWAFYVIIKNINATNEAIEAKDLAAEMARTEALREADLSIAKNIQSSALPSVFPPFPEHKEFELFASMNAAKEVGGDFYDFYMIDDNTLGFLIADVSGKSIPGAMFMMTAKSTIKSLAENGMPPAEVFTRANEKLCEGNEAEMFVTAWLGYLDLKTGLVRVANAGHNPPVLIRGGKAEYVILKPGLMLAGMDGVRYKELTLQLEKGDMLYLYTDGVTEAMDKDEEQYGEDRLKKLLSFGENYPAPSEENGIAEPVCDAVIADVRKFTDGAEQSDDITMLCVRYLGE